MEYHDLKNFITVVEYKNFTHAATQLYMTQSALSKSVQRLEQALNQQLIYRNHRTFKLTMAGHFVYAQALQIRELMDGIPQSLQSIEAFQSGNLHVGIPSLISALFFPSLVERFNKMYPTATVTLLEVGAKKIPDLVIKEEIDAGFVVLPVIENAVSVQPFIEDEFLVFLPLNHRYAQESSLSLQQLEHEAFIVFTEEYTLHDVVIEACRQALFYPKIAYKTAQSDLILELITKGLGIALLPRSLYKKRVYPFITVVPLTSVLHWHIGIITKKDRILPPLTTEFLQIAKSFHSSQE